MILTALEMQGFKSFPEKTVLTFGKGITAVVGPNGSGKSNISDAVRWVLGEQSSKSLRGSKMEDVIFDGTKIRKAHGFAQVTLRLDNKDGSIKVVDTDEVTVTRRYYRSGESEYKINGQNVRLKDVHELFMDTGLGRDGYSMVSQGKIADMVSGKGKECREMFEEAAGISAYRYRRSDSLKKLAQAEDNLVRLRDILLELESRIGPLKHQSEKAKKFLVLSEEKKIIEIGLWLYTIEKLRLDLRKQEDNIIIASGHYSTAEEELAEIEAQIEQCVFQTQSINARIDEIRRYISELEEKAAGSSSEIAVLKSSILHNNDTIDRISKTISDSLLNQKQLLKEIETEEMLIARIVAIKKEKNEELQAVNDELFKVNRQDEELQLQSEELGEKIRLNTQALAEIRVRQSTLISSLDEIKERIEMIDSLISQREESIFTFEDDLSKTNSALSACIAKIDSLVNTINGYTLMLKAKNEKADSLKRQLDDKAFDAQRKSSKIKMLSELEKNMEGYSGAVKKIISQNQKGTLEGVHGTVSQLINVKSRFAVAIEIALGNAVQHIVTDTPEQAKAAIEYLKKYNLGRATFLPISAVKGREFDEKGLDDCFGYIGVAIDLIDYDKKYSDIMSSLLGKVVVVEDLTSAIAMAKKYDYTFKIVTLDGQVINAGGSISGGSQSKSVGILTRSTEIEELKKSLAVLESEIEVLTKEYDDLSIEIDALTQKQEGEKEKLVSLQEDRIRIEGQVNLVSQQLDSAKQALEELLNEKNSASDRVFAYQQDYAEAASNAETISVMIDELEKSLLSFSSDRSQITEKVKSLTQKASSLQLDIHGADRDLQARTQALNLLKARLINHEDRDKELEGEIEGIKQKSLDLQRQIDELTQLCSTLQQKVDDAKNEIINLQKNRSLIEEKSVALRNKEKAKSSERERISGELARLEERKSTMQKEYDDTLTRLYDEYQLTKREAEAIGVIPSEPRQAQKQLHEIKSQIRALGSVNVDAIDEYKEVSERYEFMSAQVNDIEKSKKELIRLIDELTSKMSTQFREQFTKINENFAETFRELFGGGNAELILEDPTDVLESPIEIKLQPPGKNVKRLESLSGGEKGLSAIALLFAIMKVNPAPFCIFDEVEAALDDVNVTRYAQYVRRMTEKTQFILITHRRGTMEEADVLYGITMQEQGVSKLLELKTAELAKKLGITQ